MFSIPIALGYYAGGVAATKFAKDFDDLQSPKDKMLFDPLVATAVCFKL